MTDYTDINQLYINAVEQGNLADAEQFILQGANIDTKDKDGMIALITASKRGHTDIVSLILEHNVCDAERDDKIYAAMWYAIYGGFIDIIKIFLENGADVNRITPDGYSPLMIAAASGKYEVVEFLLKRGANAAFTNKEGASAGLIAKAAGHKDIEELLEEYEDMAISEETQDDGTSSRPTRRLEL